jgi:transposase
MTIHYIGFDVHCAFTEMAVVTSSGRLVQRQRLATTIPSLVEALEAVGRPRRLTFEEGGMADWLHRNLVAHADELVVCDPRRNGLVAKDSDKDDPLDAAKLAQLYRGGYLKAVHHPESLERSLLKQHVSLYHDRVKQRVREANRILARLRSHGLFVKEAEFAHVDDRGELLRQLPQNGMLRSDLMLLWQSYDLLAGQVEHLRKSLTSLAQGHEPIQRFQQLPGFGWIRAATFYVYVDTPWRFRSKSSLW